MCDINVSQIRERRLMMHKCVDLCFYFYAHICESFVAGFLCGRGCMCKSVGVCGGCVFAA